MKAKLLFTLLAASVVALESGCASSPAAPRTTSLPVEVVGSNTGTLEAPRVFQQGDRVFLQGRVKRTPGTHVHQAAHLDVQVLGRQGQVLAEAEHDIEAPHPRSFGTKGRLAYSVSFPAEIVAGASSFRISYRPVGH